MAKQNLQTLQIQNQFEFQKVWQKWKDNYRAPFPLYFSKI